MGKNGIKSFSLAGKTAKSASRVPGRPQEVSGCGWGGGALREKYYWELIKNDR
jgi:hypothetical protein